MQRECVEYSSIPLERVEREHDGDASASDCQTLLASPHCDASREDEGGQRKEEVALCILDLAGNHADNNEIQLKMAQAATSTSRPNPKPTGGGNVLFLNGLRGLAALMVVEHHLPTFPGFKLGSVSVDVFFVLSAFLLTMLFERKCRQLLDRRASVLQWVTMLVDYFCKRFLRVYPMLVVVALLLTLFPSWRLGQIYYVNRVYSAYEVLTFKFEARYFVLWTMAIEIEYYLYIPVFVAVVIALRRFWWVLALPLYAWVFYEGIYTFRRNNQPLRPHLSTFVAGSLAAVMYSRLDQWIKASAIEFSKWQRLVIRVVELVILGLFLSSSFQGLLFHWVIQYPYDGSIAFSFVSVSVSALIVIEMLLPSALARFLEVNLLCYAGRISFSIYLMHPFVIHSVVVSSQPDRYDRFLLDFGGAILLASVTYWSVEYPSQLAAQHLSKLLARVGAQPISLAAWIKPRGQ